MPTDKPRVLHVIARFNVGGTARYLNNLLPQLADEVVTLLAVGHVQGHEIEDSSLENIEFVRIEHLGRRINPIQDIRAYLALLKTVREFKPQIIHSHTFKAGLLCRLMFFRIPKVHTFHGHLMGDPEFSKRALQVIINIERRLAKVTKHLITVGEQVSNDLLKVGVGIRGQYLSIASEGQKLAFLDREEARRNLNLDPEAIVVLWMARMAHVKNPKLGLEVARLLPEIDFLMAGGGDLFNQTVANAPPNLRPIGWANAAEIIPAADIFLSTSLNEGVPYSLLEVQSFGLPIVAVDSGAISELVQHGINGFLCNANATELARAVEKLTMNSGQRLEFSLNVRKSVADREGLPEMASAHLRLYKNLLKSGL